MLDAIDPVYTNIDPASIKIIADITAILANNYNKFFYKIYKKYISRDDLRKLILS